METRAEKRGTHATSEGRECSNLKEELPSAIKGPSYSSAIDPTERTAGAIEDVGVTMRPCPKDCPVESIPISTSSEVGGA